MRADAGTARGRLTAPAYRLLPTLRAANAQVVQHPSDRPQGTLLTGGQGGGKSALLLRQFLNDTADENAAVILLDPKSELSRHALALTPPACGKTVWFLNLEYPRFGMSPLWLPAEVMGDPRALSRAVSGVADNVVNSLLDVNEGQIFQSSRDLLYHATIGALAIAAMRNQRARLEHIYGLLQPYRDDLRQAVATACLGVPDLDQTHEYWTKVIPDALRRAPQSQSQRMMAPANKVSGLTSVPPLRRFFNHPVDMPLARIIERRDILIVDAAMGAIGEENSIACMRFLLRMLHTALQRQIRKAPQERPRVALHVDEAHYIANEHTVDMLATHRAAGLDVTLAHQFFAQLMSAGGAAVSEKIRKGILNLCQSRCLFRLGDPADAQEATRIAMAVYESTLRADPDSRARMRATPETLLHLPRFHCLASWIVNGQRAPSFIGQTYPMPAGLGWSRWHYQRLVDECGDYPEDMNQTYERQPDGAEHTEADDDHPPAPQLVTVALRRPDSHGRAARGGGGEQLDLYAELEAAGNGAAPDPHAVEPNAAAAPGGRRSDEAIRPVPARASDDRAVPDARVPGVARPPKGEAEPGPELYVAVDEAQAGWLRSRPLALVGRPIGPDDYPTPDLEQIHTAEQTPPGYAELALIDRIIRVNDPVAPRNPRPLGRRNPTHYRIVKLLDRFGRMTTEQLQRAVWPADSREAIANRNRAARKSLATLHAAGLLARHPTVLADGRDRGPDLWSLTRAGFKFGQQPGPNGQLPVIHERRSFRASEAVQGFSGHHDLHLVNWLQCLDDLIPWWLTDHWRTARYQTARLTPPTISTGDGRRRPVAASDLPLGEGIGLAGMRSADWEEIVCDLVAEINVEFDPAPKPGRAFRLRFDLIVELQRRTKPADTIPKLRKYDAFLTGWGLAHPRVQRLHGRPVCLIVCASASRMLETMRHADAAMTAALGRLGRPPGEWCYAGRAHTLFAVESDIHFGSLRAFALPSLPKAVRERDGDEQPPRFTAVGLLPPSIVAAQQSRTRGRI